MHREAGGSLSLEHKGNHLLVFSAHGEEEEGAYPPTASQREGSLAPYRTYCQVLMGSSLYFTQWLKDKKQGDQGLGGEMP